MGKISCEGELVFDGCDSAQGDFIEPLVSEVEIGEPIAFTAASNRWAGATRHGVRLEPRLAMAKIRSHLRDHDWEEVSALADCVPDEEMHSLSADLHYLDRDHDYSFLRFLDATACFLEARGGDDPAELICWDPLD